MDATKSRNLTANVPIELATQLEELVKKSGITRSQYISFLIKEAVSKQRVFKITRSIQISEG